ncbi:MAG: hypothetical protein CK550_05280 [Gemmatimonadetes bacterium]|nr:MAG: hypothetical protein CK550_05280 [Gemmatimonadota bacterium]
MRDRPLGFDVTGEIAEVLLPIRLRCSLSDDREVVGQSTSRDAQTVACQSLTPEVSLRFLAS